MKCLIITNGRIKRFLPPLLEPCYCVVTKYVYQCRGILVQRVLWHRCHRPGKAALPIITHQDFKAIVIFLSFVDLCFLKLIYYEHLRLLQGGNIIKVMVLRKHAIKKQLLLGACDLFFHKVLFLRYLKLTK